MSTITKAATFASGTGQPVAQPSHPSWHPCSSSFLQRGSVPRQRETSI